MSYWICLIILFIMFVFIVFIIWKEKQQKSELESNTVAILILITFIILSLTILLSIDMPSALNGGEVIYVSELPTTVNYGLVIQKNFTDNEELQYLRGCNWNRYEKYGNYRIRYTKLTKIVLDVEKLD